MSAHLTLIEQIKAGKLWSFPGGIHPPERKSMSNSSAIAQHQSQQIFLPINQHIGNAGELLVQVGDSVLKGQPLTRPVDGLSLPVHAPTSGKVTDIGLHVSAHPSGIPETCVEITPDGHELWFERQPLAQWHSLDKTTLNTHLKKMGIAGLGGAAFPTYVKTSVSNPIELLIINAVECEPYITADDVLMRHHAGEIVQGCEVLRHLVSAPHCVIAIEDNKPEAIEAMTKACMGHPQMQVKVVPTKYPSGGEKQLIQLVTGRQVPSGGIPADIGLVMQNVGTSYAVKRAVVDGEPLISRVVTVTGENVSQPQNLWVPLGTPVSELLSTAGFKPEPNQRLIMGGPMMGFAIMDQAMPVVKSTNCILAPSEYRLPPRGDEQACIRCGLCADACPAELLPQQLQWFAKAKDHDKLAEYNLFDCIECGACSYVCPSQIPLVQYYRIGKAEIREAEEEKIKAEKAKQRFEQRQARLEREKQERLQRHKEAAEKRKQAIAKDDSAKDKIAAALARAKAKKAGAAMPESEQAPPDSQTDSVNSPQDKVAAAIARAKAKKAAKLTESEAQESHTNTAEPSPSPATEQGATKDRVAAAIARAKAKKLEKQNTQSEKDAPPSPPTQAPVEDSVQSAPGTDAEQERKAKIAAAIQKAKLKKQASEKQSGTSESQPSQAEENDDARKAKVAAAIAKAKAKKQANEKNGQEDAGNNKS